MDNARRERDYVKSFVYCLAKRRQLKHTRYRSHSSWPLRPPGFWDTSSGGYKNISPLLRQKARQSACHATSDITPGMFPLLFRLLSFHSFAWLLRGAIHAKTINVAPKAFSVPIVRSLGMCSVVLGHFLLLYRNTFWLLLFSR